MKKKSFGFVVLVSVVCAAVYVGLNSCSAKSPDPLKLDPAVAQRLKDAMAQVKDIQAKAQVIVQATSQMATTSAQPFLDEIEEIGKAGKFSLVDVLGDGKQPPRVHVSKTGEITRVPVIETPALPSAPTKGSAK